ncbi:YifB family Mg chelatase-like AAA ATPase [Pseudodesulfovibrio indicus]|uniref:Magnesium chelatase n=1 Tax=Pseudodesulfovibrio indicus TaxID=1716143 RepID=A0A126QJC7_9BACT|nr:YifB family Mg chelatase-like AAA ATPase [Pseudodesulfovibrio indicus]AMK10093.1 magnesium chelatase [Pseudodesulfovibrio indicus]TDT86937.1 magnesium chelatase family protein [Pseudodesulfovibrio indicus]
MIANIACAALMGIDAFKVELEVDLSRSGMPAFTMVGLAEGAVRESKERVFAALKNCGFKVPPARITVNLAPADVRKEGSGYDLPLAVGILAAMGVIPPENVDGWFMAGELSLSGDLKAVPGVLPLSLAARRDGGRGIIVPRANGREGAVAGDLTVIGADSLSNVVRMLLGEEEIEPASVDIDTLWNERTTHLCDFGEVKGQEHAKRAVEIAAAGGHNLLFIGPPGSGKTMLAKRIPTVLPPLSFDEALEVTKIYSVAGLLPADQALMVTRPFRTPHHTISDVGLVGGGRYPQPGETSLAHRGVLFLDEMPEFKKAVLEVLRQPLEDGEVSISRSLMTLRYPADVMLVAAMNPCPCGYLSDATHPCTCSPLAVQRYRGRISGPLLDRIDLHVDVPAVPYEDLRQARSEIDSASMRGRILAARKVQAERYAGRHFSLNAELDGSALEEFCALGRGEHDFLRRAVEKLGLSARAYTRVLRISRTIADLAGAATIGPDHLAEAINYRSMDREG